MTTTIQTESALSDVSPSVQAHLGILQSVIERMANNSTSCKTWCITVVSAILVMVADKDKARFALIALVPTFLFLALDAYYLGLEKGFRESYCDFVKNLHKGVAGPEHLCDIAPKGNRSIHQTKALMSFSIWGFYGALFILIELTRSFVLK